MEVNDVQANKAFLRKIIESNDAKDFYAYIDGVADDFVGHNDMVPGGINGPKELCDHFYVTEYLAFPDGHHTIFSLFGEDDLVTLEVGYKGTFTGELPGIKPNGKVIDFRNNIIGRFADGKLAELRWYPLNSFVTMKELGIF